ncbi:hypothetical protein ACWOBE_07605 [Hutsoniella sourekii]
MNKLILLTCLMLSCLSLGYPVQAAKLDLDDYKTGDSFQSSAGIFQVLKKELLNNSQETGPFKIRVNYMAFLDLDVSKEATKLLDQDQDGKDQLIAINVTVENQSNDTYQMDLTRSTLIADEQSLDPDLILSDKIDEPLKAHDQLDWNLYFLFDGDLEGLSEVKWQLKEPTDESGKKLGDKLVFELYSESQASSDKDQPQATRRPSQSRSKRKDTDSDNEYPVIYRDGQYFALYDGYELPVLLMPDGTIKFSSEHNPMYRDELLSFLEENRRRQDESSSEILSEYPKPEPYDEPGPIIDPYDEVEPIEPYPDPNEVEPIESID